MQRSSFDLASLVDRSILNICDNVSCADTACAVKYFHKSSRTIHILVDTASLSLPQYAYLYHAPCTMKNACAAGEEKGS